MRISDDVITYKAVVDMESHGLRLDRVVARVAGVSRSVAVGLVNDEAVFVDGVSATSCAKRLVFQQKVNILMTRSAPSPSVPVADSSVEFSTLYCDDDIVVVDKPPGLVVHPGAGNPDGTLVNGLLAGYPEIAKVGEPTRPGIVHRLDRDTSGLMVIARSDRAYRDLVDQLRNRSPKRLYKALVSGHLSADSGFVEAPLGRSNRNPIRMSVVRGGKHAVTYYRILRRFAFPIPTSLVSCRLATGRTHQIRVHFQAIGHPVLGDRHYPGSNRGVSATDLHSSRPFLHASSLSFRHPVSQVKVEYHSELPDDLEAVLSKLS